MPQPTGVSFAALITVCEEGTGSARDPALPPTAPPELLITGAELSDSKVPRTLETARRCTGGPLAGEGPPTGEGCADRSWPLPTRPVGPAGTPAAQGPPARRRPVNRSGPIATRAPRSSSSTSPMSQVARQARCSHVHGAGRRTGAVWWVGGQGDKPGEPRPRPKPRSAPYHPARRSTILPVATTREGTPHDDLDGPRTREDGVRERQATATATGTGAGTSLRRRHRPRQ